MSIIAILQARMSSTRLPNKVLKLIVNKPMLQLQIERIQQAKLIDKIVVATSTMDEDNTIEQLCYQLNISCYRGSLDNVLDRFYQAASKFNATHIVRLTGDCPLIDPQIIDNVVALHLKQKSDYTSNCRIPCLPDGLDVEIINKNSLKTSWIYASRPSEKEHVTQYIRNNEDLFKLVDYQHSPDLSAHRWTVDEPDDFEFVNKVYQNLYNKKVNFTTSDILSLLEKQPELTTINCQINRNEGLIKSLKIDKERGYE